MLKPEYRNIFNDATRTDFTGLKLGRVSVGSEFHCYHGERLTRQKVVDWHPFDYYTSEDTTAGMKTGYTVHFVADGDKTIIQVALKTPTHANAFMRKLLALLWKMKMKQVFYKALSTSLQNLKVRVNEDLVAGKFTIGLEPTENSVAV